MNEIEVNLESKKKIITTFENGKEIQIVFSVKNKTEERIETTILYTISSYRK